MRKIYLILTLLLISSVLISQHKYSRFEHSANLEPVKAPMYHPDGSISGTQAFFPGMKEFEDNLGTTYYDLQSYNTLQKRIYVYDDGSIGATWMRAMTTGTWDDRGTAYIPYDGSEWGEMEGHIESVRTGWPCYAPCGPNGEITVSHYSPDGTIFGLKFCKRDTKGSGAWEEFELAGPEGFSIVWPAMITNGEDNMTIHILARTWGDPYEDMDGAILYYRSMDGGETWDIEHELLEDIDANYFSGVDGDGYSWAQPMDETLAFSIGFKTQDGYIMKSYDNGDSWDKVVVYESPFSPYPGGETPSYGGGDATQSVALDSEGNAHVVFGRLVQYYDETGALFYYPATEGIIYWKEGMEILDTTKVSSYTLEYLEKDGNLIGWTIPYQGDSTIIDWGTYYVGLTSHPQINIDDNDNIFVLWAGVAPGFDNIDFNYRHILGVGSPDGGDTWTQPKDYTNSILYIFSECMYPVMSPTFYNNEIYFTYVTDGIPGIHIWTEEHEAVENDVIFRSVPKDDFLVNISESRMIENVQMQMYPNPVSKQAQLGMVVEKTDNVSIEILELTGKRAMLVFSGKLTSGNHNIDIPMHEMISGCYILRVTGAHTKQEIKIIKI